MKDAARIKPILEVIERIWLHYPQLRLGQLVMNLFPEIKPDHLDNFLFYLSDDEFLQYLQNFEHKENVPLR